MNELTQAERELWNRLTQEQKEKALDYCVNRIDSLMSCVVSVFDKETDN